MLRRNGKCNLPFDRPSPIALLWNSRGWTISSVQKTLPSSRNHHYDMELGIGSVFRWARSWPAVEPNYSFLKPGCKSFQLCAQFISTNSCSTYISIALAYTAQGEGNAEFETWIWSTCMRGGGNVSHRYGWKKCAMALIWYILVYPGQSRERM